MTTKEQASKTAKSLVTLLDGTSTTIGLARDDSGYYLKVHLSRLTIQEIPTLVEGVRVEIVFTGIPKSFWAL